MSIQLLAADVAAKIAAGEVVERPANVAKELLENSVDAGATEIRVEIRDGGQRLLRVSDNGEGIRAEEVALAFQRHATSKLRRASDLDHIATFGFRGEALYSIAAVSHTTLTTRHRDEQAGTTTRLEGGVIVQQGRAGAPVGTVVGVEHLFYNVPARQKFLRQPATEAGRISSVVQRAALAHPERRFSLVNDGKLVFQSNGTGDLFDVLVKLYGLDNAKQMVPVGTSRLASNEAADPLDGEVQFMENSPDTTPHSALRTPHSPIVSGYASLPTLTRANRRHIDLFINRRHVEDRNLTYAVVQAYHTLLQVGRQPIAVIFVDIDPSEVDVNVHPRKSEVRLHSERRLFTAIQKEIRRAMVDNAPVPNFVLPGSGQISGGRSGDNSAWSNGVWSVPRVASPSPAEPPQQPLDFWTPPPAPATRRPARHHRLAHGPAAHGGVAGRSCPARGGAVARAKPAQEPAAAARGRPGGRDLHYHRGAGRALPDRPARGARAHPLREDDGGRRAMQVARKATWNRRGRRAAAAAAGAADLSRGRRNGRAGRAAPGRTVNSSRLGFGV